MGASGWVTTSIMTVFLVALYVLALRFGPRRGTWNQPAAGFRAPRRWLVVLLLGLATAHVAAGVIAMIVAPRSGVLVGLVSVMAAGGYALFAASGVLAVRMQRRRAADPDADVDAQVSAPSAIESD